MKYMYCDTFCISSISIWETLYEVHVLWYFLHFSPFFLDRERPYLIVKAVIRLSDPAAMDLVLRKRICFNVYKRHSITDKIRRRMGHTSSLTSLGVVYEIVSNIPKVSSDTMHYNIGTWIHKLFWQIVRKILFENARALAKSVFNQKNNCLEQWQVRTIFETDHFSGAHRCPFSMGAMGALASAIFKIRLFSILAFYYCQPPWKNSII